MPKPVTHRTNAVVYQVRHLPTDLHCEFLGWQSETLTFPIERCRLGPAFGPVFGTYTFHAKDAPAVDAWLKAKKVRVVKR